MYPHELSGGMKQRVCIAIAISLQPQVIVADEPTSALDVVVQWQVIDTLRQVQAELGAAVIQIGHDMGLMAHSVDRIGVMYAASWSKWPGCVTSFASRSTHTQLLIASLPSLDGKDDLQAIAGSPPSLLNPPPGCPFHPRCPYVMDRCKVVMPPCARSSRATWPPVICTKRHDRTARSEREQGFRRGSRPQDGNRRLKDFSFTISGETPSVTAIVGERERQDDTRAPPPGADRPHHRRDSLPWQGPAHLQSGAPVVPR